MWHIWMNPGTHMNESCHTYEYHTINTAHANWVMTHMNKSCSIWYRYTYLIYIHAYLMYGRWVTHEYCTCQLTHDSHEWVMSQLACTVFMYSIQYSCDTYEWVMAHIWMSHVTHMNTARRILYMPTDSWLTWMSPVAYDTGMGWLRLVGSLKL